MRVHRLYIGYIARTSGTSPVLFTYKGYYIATCQVFNMNLVIYMFNAKLKVDVPPYLRMHT